MHVFYFISHDKGLGRALRCYVIALFRNIERLCKNVIDLDITSNVWCNTPHQVITKPLLGFCVVKQTNLATGTFKHLSSSSDTQIGYTQITEVNLSIYLPTGCFMKLLLHSSGHRLDISTPLTNNK